ncbi:P-loop containing nucleoside triphosphate hydrolase protein [Mycena rebaudengoi]|nr:P-loop containing nucleoside triphosphate hydrolase protein [Mycena rebaudengoi]
MSFLRTTPLATPSTAGTTSTSPDWLANLILTAKTITAAAEYLPFPYVKGALGPVIPILEAVQKMTKNRDDFEELCESIVEIVSMLQEKISRHGVEATSSLQQFCQELEGLLQEIQYKLGEIQAKPKKGLGHRLKQFATSASIGDELAKYKIRLKRLRSNFILSSTAQLNINASTSVTKPQPPRVTTSCPPPSRVFRGRQDILKKMHDYFSENVGKRHVCLLHGLGGAGKTQICLKFVDETAKARFTDVFFLDASTIDTIKSGFKNIALTQSIGSDDEDTSRWLSSHQDEWMLIFDNADNPSINLSKYFPQSSGGNILITSRNPKLHVHAPDSHHHISNMEEKDAVQLLLASAVQPLNTETENLATEIVKALHCFPLTVVQAGAFIAQTGKFKKYLTLYEQNHAQLLSRLSAQSHDQYAWSVYTTWDISFKCLSPVAAIFLQICSFLHHEGISEDIFSAAARYKCYPMGPTKKQIQEPRDFLDNFMTQARTWDALHFTDITTELQGYSLIDQDPSTDLLSIHPLVHDWSRNTITDTKSTQECAAAILAMSVVDNDRIFMIKLWPHVNSVLHADPQLIHKFQYPYQRVYYEAGHFQKAQELSEALLKDRKHILGTEHPLTLHMMTLLAVIYWKLGKFKEAEDLTVVALQKRKQLFGAEHPKTLVTMANLAATYSRMGKWTEAGKLQLTVLEKRKKIFGTEDPKTLSAMLNLAITHSHLGKFTDAEELKVLVLDKRKQLLGIDHPATLAAMASLAVTYSSLKKFAEAEELQIYVLEKRKQMFGPDHPDTLIVMPILAATYMKLGKCAPAEQLLIVVLERRTSTLGPEHPDTIRVQESLTQLRKDFGA